MKNKKIIISSVILLVILIIGSGSLFSLKADSLDSVIDRQNIAEKDKKVDVIWNDMHPDDKDRWLEQEYKSLFQEKTKDYLDVQKKEIIMLDQWIHPVTGKTYNGVAKVVNTYTVDTETSYNAITYFSKSHNKWYFFSTSLSDSDRKNIKNTAKQGPNYKELIKNSDRFIGNVVVYSGKVIQIQEEKNGDGFIRLNLDNDLFSDEIIFVNYSKSTDVVEDDLVTIYGILNGSYTYTSQANYNITIPSLNAGVIEKGHSVVAPIITGQKTSLGETKPIAKSVQRVDGLTSIRVSGGLWVNWDADVENDGPEIEIVYLDKNGEIISSDATEKMPISAEVTLLASKDPLSKKEEKVFSSQYSVDQIILGNIYPKIRIAKEKINVDPEEYYEFGVPVVTIHTPEQGDFSSTGYMIRLYEN